MCKCCYGTQRGKITSVINKWVKKKKKKQSSAILMCSHCFIALFLKYIILGGNFTPKKF